MNRTEKAPRGLMREEALQALREAVWGVIQRYKRLGLPLILWRDGKVVHVPADEAEAQYLAEEAQMREKNSDPPSRAES